MDELNNGMKCMHAQGEVARAIKQECSVNHYLSIVLFREGRGNTTVLNVWPASATMPDDHVHYLINTTF